MTIFVTKLGEIRARIRSRTKRLNRFFIKITPTTILLSLRHIPLYLLPFVLLTACLPDGQDVAERYEVTGVDVSHYQGVIDWEELAADGHDFAFIKATEGKELKDKAFFANWQLAGQTGMRRGAYHFFRPEVKPDEQARNFFATVSLVPGDLPPVIDVEDRGRLSAAQLVRRVKQLAENFELRYGVKPIIYTGQNFYNRFLAGQFDEYTLWLARYDTQEPVTVCGRTYAFWQYTDEGKLPGVVGKIDRNVFMGSHLDLALMCIPAALSGDNDDLANFGE
ncbi:MAG: GH25 family lysozyme [Bacteroidota bacterium]